MTAPTLVERIEQFRKMTQDDPDNELGHFRLGQLYMEAEQHEDAARSFQRTLVLSPVFSRVYLLLAQCQLQLNRKSEAIETLTNGFKIAEQRGDKIPRDEMRALLVEQGAEVPEVQAAPRVAKPGHDFPCQRPGCVNGGVGPRLESPPLPDEIGQQIAAKICLDCWQDWFRNYSIKVINELRLDLSTDAGQAEYDKYMRGFFGFED